MNARSALVAEHLKPGGSARTDHSVSVAPVTAGRVFRRLLALLAAGGGALTSPLAAAPPTPYNPAPVETITDVRQFWALKATAGDREYPVRATLTINYYDTDWHILYVDWHGTGAFLKDGGRHLPFAAGQRIELNGFARPREEQILWEKTKIDLLADSAPTPPRLLTDIIEDASKIDAQRVELAGLVAEQEEVDPNHVRLVITAANWSIVGEVHVRSDEPVPQWQGAFVRIKGLFSVKQDATRAGVIYELWVNQPSDVTVSSWLQSDPRFTSPTVPIEELASYPPAEFVHIAGTFQGAQPGKSITVRDQTGQIRLMSRQPHQLNKGDPVEAIGRPTGTGLDLALREGVFRPLHPPAQAPANASVGLAKLRVADQIRALSPEEAERGYPVQLNGLVTWSDPVTRTFFFQDASGAAKVVLPPDGSIPTPEFKASVLVSGATRAGEFVSEVRASAVAHGPGSPLPSAQSITLEQAMTGVDYAHWVETRGYVRSATADGPQTRLELTTASGEFVALAPPLEHPGDLVGALVQFRAVCDVIVNDRRQLVGVRFLIPAPDFVQILEPAPTDPFATPIRPIGSLLQYGGATELNHRVQVSGVVVLHQPGSLLYVQDGRDSLLVLSRQTDALQPGDRVNVVGFPGHSGWRLMMRDAVYRRTGRGPEPTPQPLEAIEPARIELDGQLVHVRGRLFNFSRIGAGTRLQLQAGNSLFEANWPAGDLPGLEAGSVIELSGVYRVELDEYLKPRSFTVNLRTASDVRVVDRPSWWTATRILWATAALLAFGMLSVAWSLALARKNRLLHHTQQALNESNTALEARVAERTRALRLEVAERQHAEEELRTILRTTIDGFYMVDPAGRILETNESYCAMIGYSREELLKMSITALDVIDTDEVIRARIQQIRSLGYVRFETKHRRKDGQVIDIDASCKFLEGGEGKLLAFMRDITERKQADERLRKQVELLDSANDAIYVRALDHTVTYWNKGAARLYGWSAAETVGHKITELGLVDPAGFSTAHAVLLAHGDWSGEVHKTGKDGKERVVYSRWTLLRDEHGHATEVLAINADITDKKKLESQFLRAQRMEGIGMLAGGIAHDLNNILTPIMMSTTLLRDAVHDHENRQLLDAVQSSAQRGADIIRQLLTFARGQPGVRAPIPIRRLLREMETLIRETFPRNLRLVVTVAPELWPVVGDATQIHQAIMNLCVNARDAMPDGGMLTLAADNDTLDAASAALMPDAKPGPHVRLCVTDTGTGISPAHLDRIFDPFFTTKEIGQGTGLGLPTVLGIVKGHGGAVRVVSQVGQGTTFELYLPASPEAKAAATPEREERLPHGHGELILLVDDEVAMRRSAQHVLEKFGYRVLDAAEGEAALALFVRHRAEIKAVLTDMMMPGMDGPKLVHALRQLDARLPILGMTGLIEQVAFKGLEGLDAVPLLAKPFEAEKLLVALHQTLAAANPTTGPAN